VSFWGGVGGPPSWVDSNATFVCLNGDDQTPLADGDLRLAARTRDLGVLMGLGMLGRRLWLRCEYWLYSLFGSEVEVSERGGGKDPDGLRPRGDMRRLGGLVPSTLATLAGITGGGVLFDVIKFGMLMPKIFFLGLFVDLSSRADFLAVSDSLQPNVSHQSLSNLLKV
jgi:hypothetical protein